MPVWINLATEDALSEAVLRRLIAAFPDRLAVAECYRRNGFGYLRSRVRGFNQAARIRPWILLTDLDQAECPAVLLNDWLRDPKHPQLLFRVAVRQVESWLLADGPRFAEFAGIRPQAISMRPDELANAKASLIELVSASRRTDLRRDVVPETWSTARQGPNYNSRLVAFVQNRWRPRFASHRSQSLARTFSRIEELAQYHA